MTARCATWGTLTGKTSVAYGVNDRGEVVGNYQKPNWGLTAFRWYRGKTQELNDLLPANSGWRIYDARAINDRGEIVGQGMFGGRTRGVLMRPRRP